MRTSSFLGWERIAAAFYLIFLVGTATFCYRDLRRSSYVIAFDSLPRRAESMNAWQLEQGATAWLQAFRDHKVPEAHEPVRQEMLSYQATLRGLIDNLDSMSASEHFSKLQKVRDGLRTVERIGEAAFDKTHPWWTSYPEASVALIVVVLLLGAPAAYLLRSGNNHDGSEDSVELCPATSNAPSDWVYDLHSMYTLGPSEVERMKSEHREGPFGRYTL